MDIISLVLIERLPARSSRGVKGGQGGWGGPKTAHFWQFFGETSIGSTKWLNLGQVRPNIISTHKN